MFKLIGLAGKAGSGKSLLGNYIESIDPENIRQDSFAYPMKKALAVMLDISVEKLELLKNSGNHHQLLNKTYREMLQTIGTEWGRNIIH